MASKKKAPRGSEFWQILFPTLVGAALILALGVWLGLTRSSGSLSRFAEISTVLLAISVSSISLLIGLLLVRSIILVNKLIKGIQPITEWVLGILDKIQDGVKRGSGSLARLVIEPAAVLAVFQRKPDHRGQEIKIKD